jgi:hypothetical protein
MAAGGSSDCSAVEQTHDRCPEATSLTWPEAFLHEPKGERLEFSEADSFARRTSGVSHGVAFIGPLTFERGLAYFEVEVAELEKKGSQTLALGICCSLPAACGFRAERARDLTQSSVLGYDLPKIYTNSAEVSKISTKQWRPLKELTVGDRVGLLIGQKKMELTVFVNGTRKASATGLSSSTQTRWPNKVWGVVDVHGTVRELRLVGPKATRRQLSRSLTVEQVALPPTREDAASSEAAPDAHLTETQVQPPATQSLPPAAAEASGAAIRSQVDNAVPGLRRASTACEASTGAKKRLRMTCHPCGCMVHLLRQNGDVVHVPRPGDFVIGRNPKSCNLILDSADVPNMVSRRHAVIVSADDAVILMDCESMNGTFVNNRRVGRETLRQGDVVVIGNPTQSPAEFRLTADMPA